MKKTSETALRNIIQDLQSLLLEEQQAKQQNVQEILEPLDYVPLTEQYATRRKQLLQIGAKDFYDPARMSRFENGKIDMKLSSLVEIATSYGCHLELVPNSL